MKQVKIIGPTVARKDIINRIAEEDKLKNQYTKVFSDNVGKECIVISIPYNSTELNNLTTFADINKQFNGEIINAPFDVNDAVVRITSIIMAHEARLSRPGNSSVIDNSKEFDFERTVRGGDPLKRQLGQDVNFLCSVLAFNGLLPSLKVKYPLDTGTLYAGALESCEIYLDDDNNYKQKEALKNFFDRNCIATRSGTSCESRKNYLLLENLSFLLFAREILTLLQRPVPRMSPAMNAPLITSSQLLIYRPTHQASITGKSDSASEQPRTAARVGNLYKL